LMTLMASDSFMSSFALLFNIGVVVYVFWDISDKLLLSIWAVLLFIIIGVRTIFAKLFLEHKFNLKLKIIESIHKFLTLYSVVILSFGFVYILPNDNPIYQAFLGMIIAGLGAGSVMSLSYNKNLVTSYLVILILPFIYVLHEKNKTLSFELALLVILFLVMLIIFAKKYHKNIVSNIIGKYLALKAKKELQISERNFSSIFQEVPIGVFTYNSDLVITQLNKTFARMLHSPIEAIQNLDMKTLKDTSVNEALFKAFHGKKGAYEGKYDTHATRKIRWIKMSTVPLYNTEGDIVSGLAIVQDITKYTESKEKLKYQAFYDSLTGLLNRTALSEQLKMFMNKINRSQEYGALLFIDLDNFKYINDSLGHNVGDAVLQTFALKMKNLLRKEDLVSRLGGDEFVILISQTALKKSHINEIALRVSNKIHQEMRKPIQIEDNKLHITLSLGIKVLEPNETDITTILKHADIAMYQSKNSGKNKTSFYDNLISKEVQQQLTLHNELKQALKENQFELYFQPITDTKTDKIVSAEALIRWNHPQKGLIFPDNFIEYAEKSDLIIEIGTWVIQEAFKLQKELQMLENININISSKQFSQPDFITTLLEAAQKYKLNPNFVKLELTESIALHNLKDAIQKMNTLKSHGFMLSMDDFGTGFSSLSYLKNLPFDYIKIDQSFIRNVLENESDQRLVKIIVEISKQFNFLVIAEGVETKAHVDFIKNSNCDYYQGYFVSKPLPLEQFKELLV